MNLEGETSDARLSAKPTRTGHGSYSHKDRARPLRLIRCLRPSDAGLGALGPHSRAWGGAEAPPATVPASISLRAQARSWGGPPFRTGHSESRWAGPAFLEGAGHNPPPLAILVLELQALVPFPIFFSLPTGTRITLPHPGAPTLIPSQACAHSWRFQLHWGWPTRQAHSQVAAGKQRSASAVGLYHARTHVLHFRPRPCFNGHRRPPPHGGSWKPRPLLEVGEPQQAPVWPRKWTKV